MKCPRCGSEMQTDMHRKIPLEMCYECGYIEGRDAGEDDTGLTNYQHARTLNLNELAAFMAGGLGIEVSKVADWLSETV